MENHDQRRLASYSLGDARHHGLLAFSFFTKGPAFVYAGEEYGATHQPSLFDSDKINWDAKGKEDAFKYVSKLIALKKRKENGKLRESLFPDSKGELFVVENRFEGYSEWGVFNFSGNPLPLPEGVLPKGNYVFEVKATDKYGVWSKNITSLDIKCLPAFYETWWAKLLYWISAALFILFMVWYDIRRRNRKNEELYSDSIELSKMREYLVMSEKNKDKSDIKITETEVVQLDELLLQKILKAVEDNMAAPDFDVSVLAEKVGMSRSSLQRKLKSITGLTPLEYIKKVKMKHAKLLLEDHSRTVSEVALTLGYFNRKHFSNCFKEEYGMNPGEYQQSLLETHNKG